MSAETGCPIGHTLVESNTNLLGMQGTTPSHSVTMTWSAWHALLRINTQWNCLDMCNDIEDMRYGCVESLTQARREAPHNSHPQ